MDENDQRIFDAITELLAPFNSINLDLKPETDIARELNIDSVAVMDFVMELEDKFDIDIPLTVLSETHTITDLIDVVKERAKA